MMKRSILSLWSWFALGVIVIVWTPIVFLVWIATTPFDKGRYATGYTFRRLCVLHQWLNPMWKFKTSGQLPANKRNPYVMVSNHESFVDMLLLSHLKMEMKYLSKESFLRIPLVGWMMKMSGDVSVLRGDRSSGAAALIVCEKWLKRKMSVMIFPEGTRSFDGEMRSFKDGAFVLAIRTQTPMLPVVVHGTRSALRKSDWRMGDTKAEVRVLEIIETTGMTLDDVPALRERVRDAMIAEIAKMRLAA
ncbi:MAG: 1-acyl-sn-glycerol-3-phosphate acyltransferase [Ilumatobacteraceae bacterium]|nr:1-acyl-sn-glycerol-3-phosphate acyltransferase [Ilumatobacteraceae bacterium]MBJ7425698.1 1-acyl-sn-glycerol-3-phosphate acyltransferase [Ilumatobacteraceae bacterium]